MTANIIKNEKDLYDYCREFCVCSANYTAEDSQKLMDGIKSLPHPEFGTDWNQWLIENEDNLHHILS